MFAIIYNLAVFLLTALVCYAYASDGATALSIWCGVLGILSFALVIYSIRKYNRSRPPKALKEYMHITKSDIEKVRSRVDMKKDG